MILATEAGESYVYLVMGRTMTGNQEGVANTTRTERTAKLGGSNSRSLWRSSCLIADLSFEKSQGPKFRPVRETLKCLLVWISSGVIELVLLRFVVRSKTANPNIPEAHPGIVILQHQRVFGGLRCVVRHLAVHHGTH